MDATYYSLFTLGSPRIPALLARPRPATVDPMSDMFTNLPTDLRDLVRRAAIDHPDHGITIFDGRGRNADRRSYADLVDLATTAAARFDAMGIGAGEPVMVALPTSWEWLEAWMGLLFCGALPVASSAATGLAAAETQLGKVDQGQSSEEVGPFEMPKLRRIVGRKRFILETSVVVKGRGTVPLQPAVGNGGRRIMGYCRYQYG